MDSTLIAYEVSATDGWVLEPASKRRDWMDAIPNQFAYRCLPLVMGNQFGWVVRSPTAVEATWNGDDHFEGSMEIRVEDDTFLPFFLSHFGFGILTVSVPWLFRTSKGLGLLVRGPTNTLTPNMVALDAFVETDWAPQSFTMNWRLLEPGVPARFEKGDPVCHLMPYPIAVLEECETRIQSIDAAPDLKAQYDRWADQRRTFNDKSGRKPEEWQKDYMVGRLPDGTPVEGHRSSISLSVPRK